MPARTTDEIRASIEQNRAELGTSLEKLRVEVTKATDWRGQLRSHQREVMIGAAVSGFLIGGGFAALGTIAFGGRGKKSKKR